MYDESATITNTRNDRRGSRCTCISSPRYFIYIALLTITIRLRVDHH